MESRSKTWYVFGEHLGESFTEFLYSGTTIFGKGSMCDVVIKSSLISKVHAVITFDGDIPVLFNYGTLGTFVNNKRIGWHGHVLQHGDIVTLGFKKRANRKQRQCPERYIKFVVQNINNRMIESFNDVDINKN